MTDAWVVAVDMGYGHERAALPLLPIAHGGKLVVANNFPGISREDKLRWEESENSYYLISRAKERGGLLGRLSFALFDRFQRIRPLRPASDERRPTAQLRELHALIAKGWGKGLIEHLAADPRPLVTTFFTVAHMAEHWGYPEPIYVVTTDTDISRAWAPLYPARTPTHYFASTEAAALHLERYGVAHENILLTGFPLPQELTRRAARDFERRTRALRPAWLEPVTITFSVGGAGAQAAIGDVLSETLRPLLKTGKLRLCLVAGTNRDVEREFHRAVHAAGFAHHLEREIRIFAAPTKEEYFKRFDALLTETDVLWTKPSELSFYAALGLPILMAEPVGSQEERNREWLLRSGAGIDAGDPHEAYRSIADRITDGTFLRAAELGYHRLERQGTEKILKALRDA